MAEGKSERIRKSQKDLDDFVANLQPKPYKEGWPEDKWEEEMEKHPFFMEKNVENEQDLPPLVEALRQLKYDPLENTPYELAKTYKEDGNENFKNKKYRWAVYAYTEGLKQNCEDKELISQLYCNRAAAHYHIGNYRKSLKDATEGKLANPANIKAYVKGAECCSRLGLMDECLSWCEEGLQINDGHATLLALKEKWLEKQKVIERNERKEGMLKIRRERRLAKLKQAFDERSIQIHDFPNFRPVNRDLQDFPVHLDHFGSLIWPVIFLYPEYCVNDCIQEFHEDHRFADHFRDIFSENNRPEWDEESKYWPENLQLYFSFECGGRELLVSADPTRTLKSVLGDPRLKVRYGTPIFSVTARGSKFDDHFAKEAIRN